MRAVCGGVASGVEHKIELLSARAESRGSDWRSLVPHPAIVREGSFLAFEKRLPRKRERGQEIESQDIALEALRNHARYRHVCIDTGRRLYYMAQNIVLSISGYSPVVQKYECTSEVPVVRDEV